MSTNRVIEEAQGLISDGLMGAAADLLEEFIEDSPNSHEALLLISQTYQIMGQQDLAAFFYDRSLASKELENSVPISSQFGANDAEYYVASTVSQPEYVFGQEHGQHETISIDSTDSASALESAHSQDLEIDIGDYDSEFDEFPSESQDIEGWENIVLDDQFVDIEDGKIDYEEVVYLGQLTLEQGARQIVGHLAEDFDFEEDLFEQLIQIFVFHKCHGQTRKAVKSLLSSNVSARELALVFDLRTYWINKEGFARTYYGNSVNVGYINLSWSLGLALVRSIGAEDIDEMILFVEDCFDDWSCSTRLIGGFNSFRSYMLHIVEHMVSVSPEGFPAFIDYQYFQDDESLATDFAGGVVCSWLEDNQLLYRAPVPYYATPLLKVGDIESSENE